MYRNPRNHYNINVVVEGRIGPSPKMIVIKEILYDFNLNMSFKLTSKSKSFRLRI